MFRLIYPFLSFASSSTHHSLSPECIIALTNLKHLQSNIAFIYEDKAENVLIALNTFKTACRFRLQAERLLAELYIKFIQDNYLDLSIDENFEKITLIKSNMDKNFNDRFQALCDLRLFLEEKRLNSQWSFTRFYRGLLSGSNSNKSNRSNSATSRTFRRDLEYDLSKHHPHNENFDDPIN
jgi:hypothetical protein